MPGGLGSGHDSASEPLERARMVGVGARRRAQAHARGRLRLRASPGGDFRLPRAARLRPRLFRPQGRGRLHRRGDLEDDLQPAAAQAAGGHRGHRHRAHHDLSRQVQIPDRHRHARAGRDRRAHGAARGAAPQAHRRGPVRARAQAPAALSAAGRRRRHLADRGGHPRHPAPARRPLPAPRAGLAGARAGRDLGRGGGRSDPRLQRPRTGRADPAPGRAHRRARRRLHRGSVGLQRGGGRAGGGGERHPARRRRRPRDRLDADRPRRRHARADADRRRRDGGAGPFRARRHNRRPRPPARREPACAASSGAGRSCAPPRAPCRARKRFSRPSGNGSISPRRGSSPPSPATPATITGRSIGRARACCASRPPPG